MFDITSKVLERQKNKICIRWLNLLFYVLPYKYGLNTSKNRSEKLVVSFTSYPQRFDNIRLTIKTILYQSFKPDKIILYLSKEECNEDSIPSQILKLQKYGLKIVYVDKNLKPHKKYYYSMLNYSEDIIVTIDDDILYPRNFLKSLYKSYKKYPDCISAARVHLIQKNNKGIVDEYNKWVYECQEIEEPSYWLFPTGAGGILYPPHILPKETFQIDVIEKICLGADDIWLKYMETLAQKKVVYVAEANKYLCPNLKTEKEGLFLENVKLGKNDEYLKKIGNYLGVELVSLIESNEKRERENTKLREE